MRRWGMIDPSSENEKVVQKIFCFPKKMNQCVKLFASLYLKDTRIKPQYLIFISGIGNSDGISQKDLNELVPFDKSYVSTVVRELIELGFVYNDSSGKVHCLRLTDFGRDIYAMSSMMFDLLDKTMFDVLTDEEKRALEQIMQKLNNRADEIIGEYSQKIS